VSRTRIDAEAPLRVRSLLEHCVFFRKELPFAGYSVVKELSILARKIAVATSSALRTLVVLASRPARAGGPTAARAIIDRHGRNLVENTGLEPVTSWLQTRRSPS
jgi:hypothetical protein